MLSLGPLPRPRPQRSEYIVKEVRALLIASPPPSTLDKCRQRGASEAESPSPHSSISEGAGPASAAAAAAADAATGAAAEQGDAPAAPRRAQHWISDTPIANPCSLFEEYKASRTSWGVDSLGSVVVEVELLGGVVGVGVSVGGAPACYLVEEHLSRFVEGQDVRNIEYIWEQMFRGCQSYGTKGLTMHALSAIDLALWDALGKARNEPVYNLLGGKTKELLPICATSVRPDFAQALGFRGCKLPLPFGPVDGADGMRRNMEHLKRVRAVVGAEFPLILDCFMSLTVPYAIELARRISAELPGGVLFIEEPFPPHALDALAEVRQKVGHLVQFSSGEHEYTLQGFRQLLERKCVDVLQLDVTIAGGVTEMRRVIALAKAHDIPVMIHAASSYSLHLEFASINCPFGEMMVVSPNGDCILPLFGGLFLDEPSPDKAGYMRVSDKPGFGLTVNKEVRLLRPYSRVPASFEEIEAAKDQRTHQHRRWLLLAEKIPLGVPDDNAPEAEGQEQ